jgi:preprotein translocase subunit YajC
VIVPNQLRQRAADFALIRPAIWQRATAPNRGRRTSPFFSSSDELPEGFYVNSWCAALIPIFGADAPPAGGDGGGGIPFPIMAIVMIVVLGYFLVWAPERKKQRAYKDQLAAIKKNDRVVTIGGIYGVVANINREADKVTLKVDDNTKIDFTLGAISRVITVETQDKEKDSSKT